MKDCEDAMLSVDGKDIPSIVWVDRFDGFRYCGPRIVASTAMITASDGTRSLDEAIFIIVPCECTASLSVCLGGRRRWRWPVASSAAGGLRLFEI